MKRIRAIILSLVMAMMLFAVVTPTTTYAATTKTPSAVTVTYAKSTACNKVTIKWSKASKATHYRIYYRQKTSSGWSKWVKIKTVTKGTTTYTHTSSAKYPIKAGTTYQYAVRGYNKTYNKAGKYTARKVTTAKHSYGSYTVTKKATCSKAGSKYKICKTCGKKYTATISPLGHSWVENYTTRTVEVPGETVDVRYCSYCSDGPFFTYDEWIEHYANTGHGVYYWSTYTYPSTTKTETYATGRTCTVCKRTENY